MGYVNNNLEARGRDVRFKLKRECCRSWVQVDYGGASADPASQEVRTI